MSPIMDDGDDDFAGIEEISETQWVMEKDDSPDEVDMVAPRRMGVYDLEMEAAKIMELQAERIRRAKESDPRKGKLGQNRFLVLQISLLGFALTRIAELKARRQSRITTSLSPTPPTLSPSRAFPSFSSPLPQSRHTSREQHTSSSSAHTPIIDLSEEPENVSPPARASSQHVLEFEAIEWTPSPVSLRTRARQEVGNDENEPPTWPEEQDDEPDDDDAESSPLPLRQSVKRRRLAVLSSDTEESDDILLSTITRPKPDKGKGKASSPQASLTDLFADDVPDTQYDLTHDASGDEYDNVFDDTVFGGFDMDDLPPLSHSSSGHHPQSSRSNITTPLPPATLRKLARSPLKPLPTNKYPIDVTPATPGVSILGTMDMDDGLVLLPDLDDRIREFYEMHYRRGADKAAKKGLEEEMPTKRTARSGAGAGGRGRGWPKRGGFRGKSRGRGRGRGKR